MSSLSRKQKSLAALLLLLALVCYPYVKHSVKAVSFADALAEELDAKADFQITEVDSGVDSTPEGGGGHCFLTATVTFTSHLSPAEAEEKVNEITRSVADTYFWPSFTALGTRNGRNLFRFSTGTLDNGGTWDLRCG